MDGCRGNALASGFQGVRCPVNPNYDAVQGKARYASVGALPETPDCVVAALPAARVPGMIEEAVRAGVSSGIVVAEGFAGGATSAGRRQEELKRLAASGGMAVTGPCCMGVASLRYGFANSCFSIPEDAVPGGVSLISQSGGLTNAVAELGASRRIGFNYIISSGNEAVVETADYIEYLADDPATQVIACLMEGARDGARLRRVLAAATRKKPVVVLKLGRTQSGQRATVAHTGTLAGRQEAYAALFREIGAATVETLDELVETAGLFRHARRSGTGAGLRHPPRREGCQTRHGQGAGAVPHRRGRGRPRGVAHRPCEPGGAGDRYMDAAREIAASICLGAPLSVIAIKEAITRGMQLPLEQGLRPESELGLALSITENQKGGSRAFAEKRPPQWQGR